MNTIQFLETYFKDNETFFIFTLDRNNNKTYQRNFTINDTRLKEYIKKCEYFNKNGSDIYYSLNTFQKIDSDRRVRRRETHIHNIKSFYFDIDKDTDRIYPHIIELFGTPTFDINTSIGKKQLIYQFDKPYYGDTKYFSQLLQGVCSNFKTDKTFDTPRIFKLIGNNLINNKNGYKINFEYSKKYFTFEEFEKKSKQFLHLIETPMKKTIKTTDKSLKKVSKTKNKKVCDRLFDYEKYNVKPKINKKYNDLLKKYQYDYSITDISFVKWLRLSKQISDEKILVEKLFLARGYDNLMKKHNYQIDYYIKNILEKTLLQS